MKVLVIGQGGREHALVWKLAQSPRVTEVFCAPGNAGTGQDGVNVPLRADDFDGLASFAKKEGVGLTVVGPEAPLAAGIVDHFQKLDLRIFGPDREAAQLEASKVFAKEMMRHADVPTAEFRVFDHPGSARKYICSREVVSIPPDHRLVEYPFDGYEVRIRDGVKYLVNGEHEIKISPPPGLVVKADGLAAGKGVFVCSTTEEALAAVERIMTREELGPQAGRRIVIESKLTGEEVSLLALASGRSVLLLPSCQDHKRLLDGDQGPNTGGMGAYCPAPVASPELLDAAARDVFVPIIHAMRRRRTPFRGLLYAGLMATRQGPRVLEFNCRFGDPEAQPLLMRLRSDLLDLLEAVVDERLDEIPPVEWDERPAVCVVLASGGYPEKFAKGFQIRGLEEAASLPDVKVFHAGTRTDGDMVVTDGGRVLGVTALGETLEAARARAYQACEVISFKGMHYRRDIGAKGLKGV
jgi:phosphoribosylamine--glycine ligase